MATGQAPEGAVSLLPEKVSINSYDVQKDLLIIDFSKEYSDMGKRKRSSDKSRNCGYAYSDTGYTEKYASL